MIHRVDKESILCVIFIVSSQQSLVANGQFLGSFVGPLAEILIGHLVGSMNGLTWIFEVVNIIISLVLLAVALIIRQSKKTEFNPVRRSPAVYGSLSRTTEVIDISTGAYHSG